MDQVKCGKFIAKLRKDKNMTQKQLGEVLGVTKKTVFQWESGNLIPDTEMLQLLSQTLEVSINELLSGECIPDEAFCKQTEKNLINTAKESAFSYEEKKKFWSCRWRREHISLFVLLALILATAVALPLLTNKPGYLGLVPLIAFFEYGWQNNKMMIYVENQINGEKQS